MSLTHAQRIKNEYFRVHGKEMPTDKQALVDAYQIEIDKITTTIKLAMEAVAIPIVKVDSK